MTPIPTNQLIPIDLDARNVSLLDDILSRLDTYLGLTVESGLRLGGGTALAMHWKHRFSTDVDLSVPSPIFESGFNKGSESLRQYLVDQRSQGLLRRIHFGTTSIAWVRPDLGEVSLSISRIDRRDPTHMETSTGLPLAPIQDILEGKLLGRVIGFGRLLVRDAYDLCTAAEREPIIFRQVMKRASANPDALQCIFNRINNGLKRIIEERPLLEPTKSDFVYDPWAKFVELAELTLLDLNKDQRQTVTLTQLIKY